MSPFAPAKVASSGDASTVWRRWLLLRWLRRFFCGAKGDTVMRFGYVFHWQRLASTTGVAVLSLLFTSQRLKEDWTGLTPSRGPVQIESWLKANSRMEGPPKTTLMALENRMVKTASTMLPLGTVAPSFKLPDYDGKLVSLDDFRTSKGLLVVFMCNHCPYVKHVAPELARIADEYSSKGISVVGISSNDVDSHPDDAPDKMKIEAQQQGYRFPYLYDSDQKIAQAYRAACTPDFFLFDGKRELYYRGQLDDTRPKQGSTPNGKDLRAALDALLNGEDAPQPQRPSIGCNIKWKAGAEPKYFNPAGVS